MGLVSPRHVDLGRVVQDEPSELSQFLVYFLCHSLPPDGVDFNGLSPATLTFLPNSNPGSIQCVAVSLMFDNAVEATENFIVELRNNDSAVIIPAGGDLVIVNIRDMPNPFGN